MKGMKDMLDKAIEIAVRAHTGQLDKCGEPYILHPLRVMLSRENKLERICAVLHDVIEDSDVSFNDLRDLGFSEEVIIILDCITKREGEDYEDFINRVLENEIACKIKLADINDNTDLSRIKCCTDKDRERLEKYKKAKDLIMDKLFE